MKGYHSHLNATTQRCVRAAEVSLRKDVAEKLHALPEEMITHHFWCNLKHEAKKANQRGEWSHALCEDLSSAFHHRVSSQALLNDFDGLFCEVQMHNHQNEGFSGGDFGFFTTLPELTHGYAGGQSVDITLRDRALLVQAKLQKPKGGFGSLTNNQIKLLPLHHEFSAFVLYSYDDVDHTLLSPFRWQMCQDQNAGIMKQWLKKAVPPSAMPSESMIDLLFRCKAGTDDPQILKNLIEIQERPRINFSIRWPEGRKPDLEVQLQKYLPQKQVLLQKQYN